MCDRIEAVNPMEASEMEIKEIRSLTGLSQQKFGDALGIPLRTIQHWEAGTRECPRYVVDLIEYRVTHDRKFKKLSEAAQARKLEQLRKAGASEAVLEELSSIK